MLSRGHVGSSKEIEFVSMVCKQQQTTAISLFITVYRCRHKKRPNQHLGATIVN